jgi:hypothetical protein
MMKPSRPTGITIIAILQFIFGVLAVLGGLAIAAIGGLGVFASLGFPILSSLVTALGGILVVFGLLALVVGWGMWTGKGWAWTLAVVLLALGVLLNLVSLIAGSPASAAGLIIDAVILWYMFRPHIKAYFGRGIAAQPTPMTQPSPPPATT